MFIFLWWDIFTNYTNSLNHSICYCIIFSLKYNLSILTLFFATIPLPLNYSHYLMLNFLPLEKWLMYSSSQKRESAASKIVSYKPNHGLYHKSYIRFQLLVRQKSYCCRIGAYIRSLYCFVRQIFLLSSVASAMLISSPVLASLKNEAIFLSSSKMVCFPLEILCQNENKLLEKNTDYVNDR